MPSATHDPPPPTARRALRTLTALCLACLAAGTAAGQAPPGRSAGPRLTDFWVRWADDVAPLMTAEERAAFFTLDANVDRESFARAFWRSRGPAATERWGRNLEDARRLSLDGARRRVALLLGKPSRTETFPSCGGLRRLQVWSWDRPPLTAAGAEAGEAPAVLVFVRATSYDKRSLAPWTPGALDRLTYAPHTAADLQTALSRAASSSCYEPARSDRLDDLLAAAAPLPALRRRAPWPQGADGWLEAWRHALVMGDGERWPDARLEVSFPGGFNDSTIVSGRIQVQADRLEQVGPEQLFDRVTITGDVYRGSYLADSFEIVHHVAGSPAGPVVPLEFHRRLRPASYVFDLRAVDRGGRALLAERVAIEVPTVAEPAPPPAGRAMGYSHLTRPDAVLLTTFPGVELLPASAMGSGRLRLHAATTGGPIDAVEFRLDGTLAGLDDDPPYSVAIDSSTARRRAAAVALDPEGRVIARHERWVEPEERAFFVRFGRPAATHVPVTVSLPAGAAIDRVDCLRGRRSTAVLEAPPWSCPLPERFAARADYLTVRATLRSGDTAEDVLFLGASAEQIDVRLAELYLSVVDARGRPVTDLAPADFRLRDAGGELRLEGAESLANLPINVALLIDISSSMGRDVGTVAASAQRFFARVLRPGDLAALQAFNHDLHHLASFTGDAGLLGHAAAGLRAGGSTRLHDAIIYALYPFSGLGDRRALIVLSDGADVGSDYPFEQVLDEAVQAGVVVYTISLGPSDQATGEELEQLARRTGGRRFSVADAGRLDGALDEISGELRAQYLLVFRPRGAGRELAFRDIRVELLRPGLEARDIHGHYR